MTAVELQAHPDEPRLGVLRLDRPPVNALDQDSWDRLAAIGRELHDPASPYRALVVTGGPRTFAAGADVAELVGLEPAVFDRRNRVLQGAFDAIATAPQISVSAINGPALGGGLELALATDLRLASQDARLGLPEITLGIIPGSGGTQRLPRMIGLGPALDLILSGRIVRADEALRIGLVHEVLPAAEVEDAAIARGLAFAAGPVALRHAKAAVREGLERPLAEGLALEAELIAASFATADARAGLVSFLEHGPGRAVFRGTDEIGAGS
ncbi:enoyl-CoA hydratase/isomerase family protein [Nocardioides sp. cx-169]|uniref:enoyl-CoA hydratase/isomerase family protein n=1 Tax=Nocardioides sp. cx-169 TaxID=2899080 RepID=UPI001E3F9F6D|nr:enoyl-CoA hydratase/isomerase family protein [Nocardioides sp. cx-169]MCD4533660.1 enoyl-CoA hydratase/isomerase family protein [Nocardioides sp. cx-169]